MSLSYRELLNWYARLWPRTIPKPPYRHIVQMGDPILREKASSIPKPAICTQQTKKIISMLKFVMEKYGTVGLSAPQIGISQRIFLMEVKKEHVDQEFYRAEQIELKILPMTIFINPQISVLGTKKVEHLEGCGSVKGFSAKVARFTDIKVQAYDENANEFTMVLKDWHARIAQHEMDHLDGKFFTDSMIRETMFCTCWKEVNDYEGKITLPFAP